MWLVTDKIKWITILVWCEACYKTMLWFGGGKQTNVSTGYLFVNYYILFLIWIYQ